MSKAIKEVIERLSGLNLIKENININSGKLEKLTNYVEDHERRLIRIEALEEYSKKS